MDCSIIICTRNRADFLRETLESISKTVVPQGWNVELLVIDNGSTDHTKAVVNESRLGNVKLRYVHEPKPGQCQARNAGLRASLGEAILFTDDDVRVPRNWIEEMCRPLFNGAADAVAGGVTFPAAYRDPLSRQVVSSRRGWFASTHELDSHQPARMVGANMAFRRHVLKKVSKFDVELGPGALGFYDETLFSFQLIATGCKLIGALNVSVEHHFDLSRLKPDSLTDCARKMGRSRAFIFHHWEHQKSRLVFPRLVLCHLRRLWIKSTDRGAGAGNEILFDQLLKLEQELAFYREYIVQRKREIKYAFRGPGSQI